MPILRNVDDIGILKDDNAINQHILPNMFQALKKYSMASLNKAY